MKTMTCWTILVLAAAAAQADEGAGPLFEKDIRPILKANCFHCHGDKPEPEGGLDLRLRHLLMAGGESGPAIVPGKPDESYLLDRVREGEMPPGDDVKKLSPDEIGLLEKWIAAGAATARPEPESIAPGFYVTEDDRRFWSFQPVVRPPLPKVEHAERVRTPIDAFLLARLEAHGATLAEAVDRQALLRRAHFDLVGLPPPPEEVDAFLMDESPDAYEKLIDHLLASPHYGERWGRHWLDIAGYADSEGASGDDVRPYAYRYRDYVIRSFNNDKPFDQFIREQLAGDEIVGPLDGSPTPEQAEKLIATGFLQMAPDGTDAGGDRQAAHNLLVADTIKIVSTSLLGLSVGCARCHDHRFDPISQEDYYRFRAIFEPALNLGVWQGRRRLVPYSTEDDRRNAEESYRHRQHAVLLQVVERQLRKLPQARRAAARAAFETPQSERTAEQQKLLADAKLDFTVENVGEFDRAAKQELMRLEKQFTAQRREFLQAIQEAGGRPPRTFLFARGDPGNPQQELSPGELTILGGESSAAIPDNDPALPSSGRRLAYARHLTDGAHPLVARVIVNRAWMHHFGQGLCTTPTDFGNEGDRPSHPQLLDWLAREFMDSGWSLKHLHKLIMTSSAYRQGPRRNEALEQVDPQNRLLGGFPIRRLESEIVRDAILAVSGKLNRKAFGAAVPVMMDTAGEIVVGMQTSNAGVPLAIVPMGGEEWRRSVYVQSRRTMPVTFMQMFDAPAMEPNCEARSTSTAAPQSLVLMNSPFVLRQSMHFARRVRREAGDDARRQVERAWKLAFARAPTAEERDDATVFLAARTDYFRAAPREPVKRADVPGSRGRETAPQAFDVLINAASKEDPDVLALALLCQMLMSSNEFLYV